MTATILRSFTDFKAEFQRVADIEERKNFVSSRLGLLKISKSLFLLFFFSFSN